MVLRRAAVRDARLDSYDIEAAYNLALAIESVGWNASTDRDATFRAETPAALIVIRNPTLVRLLRAAIARPAGTCSGSMESLSDARNARRRRRPGPRS